MASDEDYHSESKLYCPDETENYNEKLTFVKLPEQVESFRQSDETRRRIKQVLQLKFAECCSLVKN